MKKIFSLMTVVLVGLCGLNTPAFARDKNSMDEDNYHFGYASAGLGYTSLSYKSGAISAKGGLGYQAGFGYEFRKHGFWISAGLQFQGLQSSLLVNEYVYTPMYEGQPVGGLDEMGEPVAAWHYTVNQEDKQNWLTMDIPILAGYYNNGFYVGAGFKVAFPVLVESHVKGTYAISAEYDRYVGTVSDMHSFKTYPYEGKGERYSLRPMFSVAGEIGYDVLSTLSTNSTLCHILKVGLYFEYGLRSVKTAPLSEPLTINSENVTDVTINPYFATEGGTDAWTVPYFVGVKLTYMFGGSRSATATWHKGCQCYGD